MRRVAVHQHLAGDQAQIVTRSLFEQGIDGTRMNRTEHQGAGGAVTQQFVAKHLCGRRCDLRIAERLLGDECVALEPVEQLLALRTDDAGLNIVNVGVDKAGRDQQPQ